MAEKTASEQEAAGSAQPQPQPQPQPLQVFYFNGFELNASLSDFGLVVLYDGFPAAKMAMSFTTAKTLANQLQTAIGKFEEATSQPLLSMDEVSRSYERAQK